MERLPATRSSACAPGARSSGGEIFCVEPPAGEYCEHLRWEAGGWVFVALNVPGHDNNVRHAEHGPRMQAVLAWLDEAAAAAREREGPGGADAGQSLRDACRATASAAEEAARASSANRAPGRVVLIHGDTHLYRDDEPLPGLRRIEVWGSPIVDWTRVGLP